MDQPSDKKGSKRFATRREVSREELEISSGPKASGETILASNQGGDALTLIEEYALRERKTYLKSFILALIYASVSLYFLWLLYQKSNYHV
ncbi:hypothetical protein MLD52_09325 [Puniceicoccaceae bacterium K14]|nr:hypothetical protein [Puniceicoccaceae bacterium K14]